MGVRGPQDTAHRRQQLQSWKGGTSKVPKNNYNFLALTTFYKDIK